MSDNVLSYLIKEIGEETDVLRCMNRAKTAYEHAKNMERDARTATIITKKEPISVTELTEGIKRDMEDRPSLGVVSEPIVPIEQKPYPYDNNGLEK